MKKRMEYYQLVRFELFPFLQKGEFTVLELGCGEGATLRELKKQGFAKEIIGVDVHAPSIRVAKRYLTQAYCLDVERDPLPFRPKTFDVILLPDVLEHLVDPWAVLKKMHKLLKPGGKLIISVPNIRHFSVMKDLIFRESWTYTNAGIMDQTHLRFFTEKTICRAIEDAGFTIEKVRYNGGVVTGWKKLLDVLTGGWVAPWTRAQILVRATSSSLE